MSVVIAKVVMKEVEVVVQKEVDVVVLKVELDHEVPEVSVELRCLASLGMALDSALPCRPPGGCHRHRWLGLQEEHHDHQVVHQNDGRHL